MAPDDPLTLVRSVLRWSRGFIAVGSDGSSTPVWTSTDGAHWEPLLFNTATTFWPGLLIVGMAEVRGGLVALTLLAGTWDCASACPTYSPSLPLMSWTSPDGQSWTPHDGPDLGQPTDWQAAPLLAAGPAGLVAASPTAPDPCRDLGRRRPLAAPASRGAPDWARRQGRRRDHDRVHRRWDAARGRRPRPRRGPSVHRRRHVDRPLPPRHAHGICDFTLASTGPSWEATALVAGRNGLIAVGQVLATPGATLWWQSADGRDWRPLPTWPPLGPTTCTGEGCGSGPNGALVGDGHRMVALRGGADAGAWTSADGLAWQRLAVTGDLPSEAGDERSPHAGWRARR